MARMDVALGFFPITPDDDSDLPDIAYGLNIAVGGNLAIVAIDNSTGVITGVQPGIFPIAVKRVLATGTTCTGITGFRL